MTMQDTWTPDELRAWRERHKLTQRQAAHALGLTLRGYQLWEAGDRAISRATMLACLYLDEHPEEITRAA